MVISNTCHLFRSLLGKMHEHNKFIIFQLLLGKNIYNGHWPIQYYLPITTVMRIYFRVLSTTWKPGDMNFICTSPEIALNLFQKVRKPGQNKKFCRNMDKTWNVKIYNISILYWKFLYSYNFRSPFASAFGSQNYLHYNLENYLFDLDKTVR